MVQLVGMPSSWAVRWTRSHSCPGELALGDGGPNRCAEYLRAAARKAGQSRLPHRGEHLALGDLFDSREVGDLDRSERLDMNRGMTLLESPDHVGVVAQPELGVQPADDVELAGRRALRLIGLVRNTSSSERV